MACLVMIISVNQFDRTFQFPSRSSVASLPDSKFRHMSPRYGVRRLTCMCVSGTAGFGKAGITSRSRFRFNASVHIRV